MTFTAPTRIVIDAGAPGTSVGDLTVSTGDDLSIPMRDGTIFATGLIRATKGHSSL